MNIKTNCPFKDCQALIDVDLQDCVDVLADFNDLVEEHECPNCGRHFEITFYAQEDVSEMDCCDKHKFKNGKCSECGIKESFLKGKGSA